MEIILGKFAGFCPGVKRAWSLVEKAARKKKGSIYILGELIHNKQAIEQLKKWGVKKITDPREIKGGETIVIRAHGESPETYQKLKKLKLPVIDATCPWVARVQKLAPKLEEKGFRVIICGEKNHPETKAIIGYTKNGRVISSIGEAKRVPWVEKIGVLSQTTFSNYLFKEICQILKKKTKEFESVGTICSFTQLAQKEARKIAKMVDIVFVVGGRQSSNTKRLAELTRKIVSTFHIETEKEIKKDWLKGVRRVGLLAGASTPDWIIKKVKKRLDFHNYIYYIYYTINPNNKLNKRGTL